MIVYIILSNVEENLMGGQSPDTTEGTVVDKGALSTYKLKVSIQAAGTECNVFIQPSNKA